MRTPVRVDRGEAATPLARWLDAIGPVDGFHELLDRYRREVGPSDAEAFRVWLWRDARVAVAPASGRLCLPEEWPPAPARPH